MLSKDNREVLSKAEGRATASVLSEGCSEVRRNGTMMLPCTRGGDGCVVSGSISGSTSLNWMGEALLTLINRVILGRTMFCAQWPVLTPKITGLGTGLTGKNRAAEAVLSPEC